MSDAFSHCGILVCRHGCAGAGWPIDATWLPGGLLLVEFLGDCEHTTEVRIVDPAVLTPVDHCLARTAAGTRCTRRAVDGGLWCHQHDPDRQGRARRPNEGAR
jgi:hypothetical protein